MACLKRLKLCFKISDALTKFVLDEFFIRVCVFTKIVQHLFVFLDQSILLAFVALRQILLKRLVVLSRFGTRVGKLLLCGT